MVKEVILIEEFRDLSLVTQEEPSSVRLEMLQITNEFLNRIRGFQPGNEELDLYEETNET